MLLPWEALKFRATTGGAKIRICQGIWVPIGRSKIGTLFLSCGNATPKNHNIQYLDSAVSFWGKRRAKFLEPDERMQNSKALKLQINGNPPNLLEVPSGQIMITRQDLKKSTWQTTDCSFNLAILEEHIFQSLKRKLGNHPQHHTIPKKHRFNQSEVIKWNHLSSQRWWTWKHLTKQRGWILIILSWARKTCGKSWLSAGPKN